MYELKAQGTKGKALREKVMILGSFLAKLCVIFLCKLVSKILKKLA